MPPNLRSSSRAASRAASQSATRPATPQDAPLTSQAAPANESARPAKQRKTGRKTKATTALATDNNKGKRRKTPAAASKQKAQVETNNEAESSKSSGNMAQANDTDTVMTGIEGNTWAEPEVSNKTAPRETDKTKTKFIPIDGRAVLEVKPSASKTRKAEVAPRSTGAYATRRQAKGKTVQDTTTPTNTTVKSTPAPEQPAPSEVQSVPMAEEQDTRVTRSTSDNKQINNTPDGNATLNVNNTVTNNAASENTLPEATAAASSVPPVTNGKNAEAPVDTTPLELPDNLTVDKLREIIDAAVIRAAELNDLKVSEGLRRIRDDSDSEPFLLSVVASALNEGSGSTERVAFQKILREAVRRIEVDAKQSEQEAAAAQKASEANENNNTQATQATTTQSTTQVDNDMTRTASAISSSSLSTAKSLDAQNQAPAIAESSSSAAARPAPAKTRGKGGRKARGGRATKSTNRKRKHEEIAEVAHPEGLTDDAISTKKRALQSNVIPSNVGGQDANVRADGRSARQGTIPPPANLTAEEQAQAQAQAQATPSHWTGDPPANTCVRDPFQHYKPQEKAQDIENNDFCHICGGGGELLCCDGCVDSFHFTCLRPQLDPNNPPDGEWHCPDCTAKGPMGAMIELLEARAPTAFTLPEGIRNYFKNTKTARNGDYEAVPDSRGPGVQRDRPRNDEDVVPHRLRLSDSRGRLITCRRCSRTSEGCRQLIQCDYCTDYWHMDCLDPPLTHQPVPRGRGDKPRLYFRCPNHVESVLDAQGASTLGRYRRPRHPKYVDIDVVPAESSAADLHEEEMQGSVFRVPESGVVLDFVARVKKDRAQDELISSWGAAKAHALAAAARERATTSATVALNSLESSERQAVEGLMNISSDAPRSGSDRYGDLVARLMASVPDSARASHNEADMLRSIQAAIAQRLQDLS